MGPERQRAVRYGGSNQNGRENAVDPDAHGEPETGPEHGLYPGVEAIQGGVGEGIAGRSDPGFGVDDRSAGHLRWRLLPELGADGRRNGRRDEGGRVAGLPG